LLKAVGQRLFQWHHVAFCSVDERVSEAIAGARAAARLSSSSRCI
jgi:hypothetical protein